MKCIVVRANACASVITAQKSLASQAIHYCAISNVPLKAEGKLRTVDLSEQRDAMRSKGGY